MPEETITQDSGSQAPAYPAEASREMIEAGVFYGRKKSKTNPKMRGFVLTNRGGIEVINLQKTSESLEKAMGFVKEKIRQNGLPLIVGTEPAAESLIKGMAGKFNFPYVTLRWIGGTITNFPIISKRVEHMKQLRTDLASGALVDKYTKKERLEMEREMNRLIELMGGLEAMAKVPDFMIIIDPTLHTTAVREARIKKVPIVSLANVDADPDMIDYLVPGNDKSRKSIEWFLMSVEKAVEEGMKMRVVVEKPINE